jgi:hypothetical protein
MCSAIYVVGIVVHFYQCGTGRNAGFASSTPACPQFEPMVSLGGALWCTANMLLVPLVDTIGMGLTMMLWGMMEMLAGWTTGRFHLFGVNAEPVGNSALNYVGICLAFLSLAAVVFVTPNVIQGSASKSLNAPSVASNHRDMHDDDVEALLLSESNLRFPPPQQEVKWTDRLAPWQKHAFGAVACMVAGTLSGSTFTPAQFVVDRTADYIGNPEQAPFPGASSQLLDHIFAHFTGIWLTSTVYFALYLVLIRFKVIPQQIHPDEVVPYLLAGVIWGVAMVCWFIANANLSTVVSFPLITIGPGILCVLWGVILYNEISGKRNFTLLGLSVVLYLAASVCIVLSKE